MKKLTSIATLLICCYTTNVRIIKLSRLLNTPNESLTTYHLYSRPSGLPSTPSKEIRKRGSP